MDEDLQGLVRTWATTQGVDDGLRAATARLRAGLLTDEDGRLAATLGDPVARALGFEPFAVEWPTPPLRVVALRAPRELVWRVLRTAAERLGFVEALDVVDGTEEALDVLDTLRDARVAEAWTGDGSGLGRALAAAARRDRQWLERRLAAALLFGPDLLPPVEPWTPGR